MKNNFDLNDYELKTTNEDYLVVFPSSNKRITIPYTEYNEMLLISENIKYKKEKYLNIKNILLSLKDRLKGGRSND